MKNCLTLIEQVSETRKNWSLIFHRIRLMVFKRVRLKKRLLSYGATSFFFSEIYTAW